MRLRKFFAWSVLAITLASIAANANVQSMDELYLEAKKEGALSLNGGGPAGLYEPWGPEVERRFPAIKVNLPANFSTIPPRITDRELPKKRRGSIWPIFQTLQDYDR